MANLTYRVNSSPTLPGSTTVKNSPLTNAEVDANFKAIDIELAAKATASDISAALTAKQNTLVSGTNIKTVNGGSVLGSGDLQIIGGLVNTPIKTANYTAAINDLVRLDSSAGPFTVTMPSSPVDGDKVGVFDIANACGTNAVLLAASGGKTIEGDASGLSVNMFGAYVALSYNAATTNWKILATPSMNSNQIKTVNNQSILGTGNINILAIPTPVLVTTNSQTAVPGNHYILTNAEMTTVLLPESPVFGDIVWVTVMNGLKTNVINGNSHTIMGLPENMILNINTVTAQLRYIGSDWRLV